MTKTPNKNLLGRQSIFDDELETHIIGSMFVDPKVIRSVSSLITSEMFYKEANKHIAQALFSLHKEGVTPDYISVADYMKRKKTLDEIGGIPALLSYSRSVGTGQRAPEFAVTLKELYVRRNLSDLSANVTEKIHQWDSVEDVIAYATKELKDQIKLIAVDNHKDESEMFDKVLHEAHKIREGGVEPYIKSYYPDLDKALHGWMPGNMITLAGRPGMGKTAFMCSQIRKLVKRKIRCGVFSLEMSSRELIARLIGIEARIEPINILTGKFTDEQMEKMVQASYELREHVIIHDKGGLTIEQFSNQALFMVENLGVQMIFLDYLQLMKGDNAKQTRESEISTISRGVKSVAKNLNVPIMALSQLSRETEKRGNKIPQLSDLRDSGSIEQDSDIVIFAFRPDYYGMNEDDDGNNLEGIAKLIIAKFRNSAQKSIVFRFIAKYMEFADEKEQESF